MSIMPERAHAAPVSLNAALADALSRADGCVCGNTAPPHAAIPRGEGWLTHHVCADCGATWTVEWSD